MCTALCLHIVVHRVNVLNLEDGDCNSKNKGDWFDFWRFWNVNFQKERNKVCFCVMLLNMSYCVLCLGNTGSGQWLFLHECIVYFRTCCACLEMSIALWKHSHSSVCMSTWRLVVEGLLDNLKWNNSARRAQTCACVRASSRGVKAPEVFLTSRNVNNSPSTGRREWAGERQVGERARNNGLMTACEATPHSDKWKHRSAETVWKCHSNQDFRNTGTGYHFCWILLKEKLVHWHWHHPTTGAITLRPVTNAVCMEVVRKCGFCNFHCITSVTFSSFYCPDSTKYCSTVSLVPSCITR